VVFFEFVESRDLSYSALSSQGLPWLEVYKLCLWNKCIIEVIIELALEGGLRFVRDEY
jgi:hypothetical protein